jgi:hypothetical protein
MMDYKGGFGEFKWREGDFGEPRRKPPVDDAPPQPAALRRSARRNN